MAEKKRIDLGKSMGPNKAERATIAKGQKKVEVHYGSDTAPEPVDAHEQERQKRTEVQRGIDKEHEADRVAGLKSGRIQRELSTVPGMDSTDSHKQSMAKHSADFIAASVKGHRGQMEASRSAFHAVRASSRGVPQGVEAPCSTPGCKKTTSNAAPTCGEGGCGAGPNVQRPKG